MADETTKDPVPVGDCSHLVDELPAPKLDSMPMPILVGVKEEDGTTTMPDRPATMPGVVEHVASGQEQVEGLKLIKEPCPKCEHFYYPLPDSQEYRAIVAVIKAKLATLPGWQRETLQGRDPDEWGHCRKHNGMVHSFNTRECYEKRRGTIGIGRAKDRREG